MIIKIEFTIMSKYALHQNMIENLNNKKLLF